MSRKILPLLCAAALLVALPSAARAQLGVTLLGGAYVPASDFYDLRAAAEQTRVSREATLGLGANIDLPLVRLSLAYATGATLTEAGVQSQREIGEGSVLAGAVDVLLRPLPRVIAQPYVIAGLGLKREQFSFRDGFNGNPLPRSQSDVALHIGLGADIVFGGLGLVVEISDFVSRRERDFGAHDAFALVGVRLRL
jgi:hypothetical protein